jgi:hypothetical protein
LYVFLQNEYNGGTKSNEYNGGTILLPTQSRQMLHLIIIVSRFLSLKSYKYNIWKWKVRKSIKLNKFGLLVINSHLNYSILLWYTRVRHLKSIYNAKVQKHTFYRIYFTSTISVSITYIKCNIILSIILEIKSDLYAEKVFF